MDYDKVQVIDARYKDQAIEQGKGNYNCFAWSLGEAGRYFDPARELENKPEFQTQELIYQHVAELVYKRTLFTVKEGGSSCTA
jgi:hypothetical protein